MREITLLMLLLTGVMLSSCNTIAGAGQDLSAAGRAIHNGAEEAKP